VDEVLDELVDVVAPGSEVDVVDVDEVLVDVEVVEVEEDVLVEVAMVVEVDVLVDDEVELELVEVDEDVLVEVVAPGREVDVVELDELEVVLVTELDVDVELLVEVVLEVLVVDDVELELVELDDDVDVVDDVVDDVLLDVEVLVLLVELVDVVVVELVDVVVVGKVVVVVTTDENPVMRKMTFAGEPPEVVTKRSLVIGSTSSPRGPGLKSGSISLPKPEANRVSIGSGVPNTDVQPDMPQLASENGSPVAGSTSTIRSSPSVNEAYIRSPWNGAGRNWNWPKPPAPDDGCSPTKVWLLMGV
jgi:hypothetical protein